MEQIQQFHAQLNDWFGRPLAAGAHYFLLLDHAAIPDLGSCLREAGLPYAPLWGEADSDDLHALPILVQLPAQPSSASTRLIAWIARNALLRSAVICIASPLGFSPLRQALADRCEAMLPDQMAVVLRYFDTRVLPELLRLLPEAERAAFLGFASALAYADRHGVLRPLPAQFQAQAWPAPLQLSDAQQNALLDASTADVVVDFLHRKKPKPIAALNPSERYSLASAAIAHAQRLDLAAISDFALMTLLHHELGQAGLAMPAWQASFAKVQAGQAGLAELLGQLEGRHASP